MSLGLILLGVAVGTVGTLIGAGGGFLLMPVLILLYPRESPEFLTGVSLAVVFLNAFSGSVAYARMRRIDYRTGFWFGTAATPGAVLGALATGHLSHRWFDLIFGIVLLAIAIFLLARPGATQRLGFGAERRGGVRRRLVAADGTAHEYAFNLPLGIVLSVLVGFLSSLLGIGGGIIHVPALVYLLAFPVHIATATSHFILAIMALAGTIAHVAVGSLDHGLALTASLGVGVLAGAQIGARLSQRVNNLWIVRVLAGGLAIVSVRLIIAAAQG
jgi:uncharacterized membrane protein YfcA